MEVEDDRVRAREPGERGQEPGRERVGVDRERHGRGAGGCRILAAERGERVVLEQRELAREADDGGAGLGGADGLGPHGEHATESPFELLHALRDRGGRDPEVGRGALEGSGVDDGREGPREVEGNVHEAMLMVLKNPELDSIARGP
ncbi:hypothetical protein GCM10025870_13390 [Agromyces marinus]|uniref:Uncharacterized protein n=1 Tax=Agromyces marinus TaxID=1389020 RepID=A0ABN6YAR1_9MICO|nr:hypothetical protein GCM10025870_13390 [Agromyces marinus]